MNDYFEPIAPISATILKNICDYIHKDYVKIIIELGISENFKETEPGKWLWYEMKDRRLPAEDVLEFVESCCCKIRTDFDSHLTTSPSYPTVLTAFAETLAISLEEAHPKLCRFFRSAANLKDPLSDALIISERDPPAKWYDDDDLYDELMSHVSDLMSYNMKDIGEIYREEMSTTVFEALDKLLKFEVVM